MQDQSEIVEAEIIESKNPDSPTLGKLLKVLYKESNDYERNQYGSLIRKENKIGRNKKCPCGSNTKFKKCCIKKEVI